jgi:CubicO group peptidase (beta-lactamase class C family)
MPIRLDVKKLESAIKAELAEKFVPGAAIAIVRPAARPYLAAFGVTSMNDRAAVTETTLFRLGSNSKALIAAVILQLAAENWLALHVPVSQYLTNLPTQVGRATLHQLLSHTGGLKDGEEVNLVQHQAELSEPVSAWSNSYSFTDPGDIYSYSTLGFALALETACVTTKLPAQELLARKLFRPLGMASTTLVPASNSVDQVSAGHYLDANGNLKIYPEVGNYAGLWPASAMLSNAHDLGCFLAALLNNGVVKGRQVLHPAVIRQLSTLQSAIPGAPRGYSYGFYVREQRGDVTLEHGGRCAGFGSFLRLSKAHQLGVVVLGNRYGVLLKRAVDAAFASAGIPPLPEVAVYYEAEAGEEIRAPEALRHIGQYRGGDGVIELYVHESKLKGRSSAGEFTIRQVGQDRFVLSGGAFQHPICAVRTLNASLHTYLHLEGRAFRLIEPSDQ